MSASRVADESVYEEFLDLYTHHIAELPAGDPFDERTVIGAPRFPYRGVLTGWHICPIELDKCAIRSEPQLGVTPRRPRPGTGEGASVAMGGTVHGCRPFVCSEFRHGTETAKMERIIMQRPDWAPEHVSMDVASPARMYDALLGGGHNFDVDRRAAAQAVALVPDLPMVAHSNRAFLHRSVRYLVGAGIRQLLDIGAGIPTHGNSHEVAQQADPGCRVAYIDIDPIAIVHARAILGRDPNTIAVQSDMRAPDQLLANPQVREFIDFDQPVGVLLVGVLHLLTDAEEPHRVVAALRDAVAPGSYVVISHFTYTQRPDDAARLSEHAAKRAKVPIIFRPQEEIESFFDGFTMIEPGVVDIAAWRPEPPDNGAEASGGALCLGGVGRKE